MNTNIIYTQLYHSPVGDLLLGAYGEELCLCDWCMGRRRIITRQHVQERLNARYEDAPSTFLRNVVWELDEYFACERETFDIPLLLVGTDFQQAVWRVLRRIPYGTTLSYAEEARWLGNPKAIRAVASANGSNPISILIPCHRVIGSDGRLVGYGGGLETKRALLALEGRISR